MLVLTVVIDRSDDLLIIMFPLCAECVSSFHAQDEAPKADCAPSQRNPPDHSCESSSCIDDAATGLGDT